jgi:integrase
MGDRAAPVAGFFCAPKPLFAASEVHVALDRLFAIPRLHDLRHRFAQSTLVSWYRSNQDPERRLPLLSAFLGHVHVADTQWYLSASPELMSEAMRRLEHRWGSHHD